MHSLNYAALPSCPPLPPYLQPVLHLLPTPGIFPILVQIRLAGLQVAVHMRHGSSVCCGERGLGKPWQGLTGVDLR